MKRRWTLLAAGVAGLGLAAALWEGALATPSGPPSVSHEARIVRDAWGVPHIFGKRDSDTAFGLAWAHSEDDFSTIQEVIAMTRGRAGAMLGEDGAKADFVWHLLQPQETAAQAWPTMPADVRAMLDAYAAGLNRYAEEHPEEVRLRNLFPVSGQDVAAGFVLRSPFFFGLDSVLEALVENGPLPWAGGERLTPAGREPERNGSNAFALAPRRMSDGRTWLISNSHQPYEGGVAWYEASVHSEEGLDLSGALFPGSPFVLLGHNPDLGWTNTVNRPDLIDVYRLTLNEAGDAYRLDGAWKPLETQRAWLKVKIGPFVLPVPRTIHRSIHGPVIINEAGAFAIRYAGIGRAGMLEQYYRLGKARDWDSWRAAMRLGGVPATNFIYADKSGRIAYFYNAMIPERPDGPENWQGVLPGDQSRLIWSRYLPFDAVPAVIDPPSGFVQNANNNPFLTAGPGNELDPARFPARMGVEKGMTNRGLRAVELLAADRSITPGELMRIKFDTGYSRQSFVGPWLTQVAAVKTEKGSPLAGAQALLARWDWTSDGKGPADTLAECLIHAAAKAHWRNLASPDPREKLQDCVDWLQAAFGRIDPPLLDVQRLRRGKADLPMDGGHDTLRAATSWDEQDDGTRRVKHGDSFIQIVSWGADGKSRAVSIQPYGSATTRPDSPHYTDQMKLFASRQFKPAPLAGADIERLARRTYWVRSGP